MITLRWPNVKFHYGLSHVGTVHYKKLCIYFPSDFETTCPCRSFCPRDRRGPWTFGRGATEPWRNQEEVSPLKFYPDKFGTKKPNAVSKENLSIPDGRAEVASVVVCLLPQRPRRRRGQGAFLLLLPPICRSKTDGKRWIHAQYALPSTLFCFLSITIK